MEHADWHALGADEALRLTGSRREGLSANEVLRRQEEHGANSIALQKPISPLVIFLSQFKELMVIILFLATAISAALGEFVDAAVIIVIIILNSVFGFLQEYKAEKALLALQQLSAPLATVLRDGKETAVSASEIVPGDIVVLRAGDMVPADCRLLESFNLRVNEAPLTGESIAAEKDSGAVLGRDAFIGDRSNMVFSSTTVDYGRGTAVATGIGMDTEIGRIAQLIRKSENERTPLQVKLDRMGKQIGVAVLAICIAVFAVEIIRFGAADILEIFMISVSLAVAAIPEGLPAVVTICLALGLQRMIKKNALIRRLPAVETLGSTTVICSDKTGTLTMGVMNIRLVNTWDSLYELDGNGYEPTGKFTREGKTAEPNSDPDLLLLLTAGALCNDSKLVNEGGGWKILGDSTEGAFLVAAGKAGFDSDALNREFSRTGENPFDSDKKYMTTIHTWKGSGFRAFTKGAVDRVLPLCSRKLTNGAPAPMTPEDIQRVHAMNDDMAAKAYRVLALAYRESSGSINPENAEKDLIFLGLVGMMDAPRKEAIDAIAKCKKAGVRVVMITGDHKLTAFAIARQMGIAHEGSLAVTGADLNNMSDEALYRAVDNIAVYARVSPEHKMRIVGAWKRRGQVVAMTGDGVNDAPALKKADIGIAMGITGTDVSKEAADLVLTDDNFASIVDAIEVGRGIYDNIRKFIRYMLSTNFGEVLLIFIASLLGMPLPLIAIQILWINLITDGLPAVSLGLEPAEQGVMLRKPRRPKESIFSGGMAFHIAWVGVLMTVGTLGLFWLSVPQGIGYLSGEAFESAMLRPRTMAFITIAFFQLWHVLAIHIERDSVISRKFFANPFLIVAVLASAALQLLVIYLPALSSVFKTEALPLGDLIICILVASSVFFAVEAEKLLRRRRDRKSRRKSAAKKR